MPDVGTLNLTIESNANVAASGLDKLADALSRVQQAVGTGLKLSNASRSLNSFAKAVSENSKALSNVGTFLTAITNYTKAFKDAEKVKFNAKPIEDLKNAIGEGIKIGQAGTQINKLREALGGDWNIDNAKKAGDAMALIAEGAKTFVGTNLGSIAKNVSAVGKALGEYAEGAAKVRDVVGEQKWNKNQGMSELEDAAKRQEDWFEAGGFATGKKMPLNLQQFGRRSSKDNVVQTNIAPGQYDLTAQKLITVQEAIAQSTSAGAQFYAVISEIADVVETRIIPRFREMYQIWSMLSYQQNAFAMEGARLMSGNSPLLLGDGQTPGQLLLGDGSEPETFLSVWRDTGEQWKQNWVFFASEAADEMRAYFQPDWIVGGQAVPQSMSTFHLGAGDSPLLLGDGGVSPENTLSTMVDYTEQWKQDWIVVEGTVSDVTESINEQAVAVENLTDAVRENKREAAQKVQDTYGYGSLENMFNGIRRGMKVENDLLSRFLHGEGTKNEQLYALKTASGLFGMPIDEVRQKVMELREAESGATPAAEQLSEALEQVGESAQGLQSAATAIEDIKTGIIDSSKVTAWLSKEVDNVKQGFANIAGSKLLKQFFGRAKMMAMRAAIRAISSAFQEGIENLYRYSQATGTGFAPAMDEASTALLHMKNSIAAAVSPLIQSLIPVLKSVTSAVITAVNYLNQFFALLRGQSTWTEAIEYSTQAYEDNTNAAQGAAKAAKDLLADWDELNIIQSENGGGGGGRVGKEEPDYAAMFHEVGQFDQWILDIVHGIKDTFGSVLGLVKRIGAIIFGWKVASAFAGVIGTLGALIATAGIIDIVFNLSSMFDNKYFDTGDIGWLLANVLTTFIGGVLTNRILQTVLKGDAGHIGIPLVFAVSALADIVTLIGRNDVSGLSKEGLTVSIMSALKMGTAAAYLSKTILHNSLGQSLLGGAAIAAITFGAAVGIKAIAEAVDGGQGVTPETVEKAALSSLSMGIGTAMLAKLTGASVLVAAGTGAAAAILTLTAVIGIAALLSLSKDVPQPVQWGDYHATEQQIKEYVEGKVFKVNPQAILSIVDPMIEVNTRNQQELTASVNKVRLDVKKLEIGINDEDSTLKDLEKLVFGDTETGTTGLIGKFKETASGYQNIIETGITLVPSVSNEDGTPKEIIDKSSEGWTYLTNHMDSLGSELEKHFFNAYKKDITTDAKEAELKTIQELTSMVANVSAAISRGQASEEALQSLSENIMNMDEDSFSGLFDYIDEYKKQVVDAYTKTYDEVTRTLAGQKAGLIQAIENENILAGESKTTEERNGHLALAKEYEDQLKWLDDYLAQRKEGRQEAIDKVAEDAMNDDVIDEIKRALASRINKNALDDSLAGQILDIQNNDFSYKLWEQLFSTKGKTSKNAKTIVENWLNQMIDAGYAGNADIIREALSKGYIGYGDLITNEMIDYLGESIGIGHQSKKVQSAWNKLINEIFENDKDHKYEFTFEVEPNPVVDAVETVKKVSEQTKKNLESIQGYDLDDNITAEEAMEYVNKPVEKAKQEIEQNAIEMPGIDSSEIDEGFDNITENAEETVEEIKDLFGELQNLIFESNVFDKTNYREKAQELYSSNNIEEMKRLINYIKEFGLEEGYKQFVNSGKGTNMLNRGGSNPLAQTLDTSGYARAGVPQNGGDQKSEPAMDYSQMANSVQQGTTQANTPMVNQLGSIIDQLTRLLNKQWVVNVEPTTTFGRTVNQSQTAYGNVTGDAPIFG